MDEQTTVRLRLTTKEELDAFGSKNESYDIIISKLISLLNMRKYPIINYHKTLKKLRTLFYIKCEECDMRAMEVHHKDKDIKNNSLENMKMLCPKCHTKIHNPDKNYSSDKYRR